jgi:general secretion pathway protein D
MRRSLLALLVFHLGLALPARADKGGDAYKHGQQAERRADYDAAYSFYRQAHAAVPKEPKYFEAFLRTRSNAAQRHVQAGQLLRNTGSLKEAIAEFQKAVEIDASNFIAQQELRQTTDMLRREERKKAEGKAPAAKHEESVPAVELRPLSTAPITLHLTVTSDMAYKTIGKLAGINVAIDPDFRPQKITIDLTDVTLRQALDLVRLQSKSYWQAILPNTIFVTSDSAAKRKELEQNVMRTFYLKNVTAANDLTEAANLLKSMIDVSRVQLLQGQDALIVRGTPDQMVLAQKLLADIDKPKPEVVIDVTVMEVSRDRIRTLGNTVPTSTSVAYIPGGAAAAAAAAAAGGGSSGGSVNIGSFSIAVPGTSFTFLASDSNSKVLQNPEIRVLNNEKASLKIGDRIPIATGSFQPGLVGGAGVSPLVSTQFQYIDVGVNVDITPHIHSDSEVTLKMSLEISSVTGQQSIGGITQPIIGQRRIEHEARLLDGEVNLLGGILESQETQSLSGYPWVSRIPILKYLFAQENKERTENEIVFAITPHIVRGLDITEDNQRTINVGTGAVTELRQNDASPAAAPSDAAKAEKSAPAAGKPAPASASSSQSQARTQPAAEKPR